MTKGDRSSQGALYQDFDALTEYLTDVSGHSQDIIAKFFNKNAKGANLNQSNKSADPLNIGNAYQEMVKGFIGGSRHLDAATIRIVG